MIKESNYFEVAEFCYIIIIAFSNPQVAWSLYILIGGLEHESYFSIYGE